MSKFDVLDLCLDLVKEMGEDFAIAVTLFVNGSVVTGKLINHATYLKGMASAFEATNDDIAKLMSKTFRELAEPPTEDADQSRESCGGEDDVIYLKDIAFLNRPIPEIIKGTFLVLRADAINGFVWSHPPNVRGV
jgi:hypothetical protein